MASTEARSFAVCGLDCAIMLWGELKVPAHEATNTSIAISRGASGLRFSSLKILKPDRQVQPQSRNHLQVDTRTEISQGTYMYLT